MKRGRIGVLAQYLDSRNDIRRIIELLAEQLEVVLFLRPGDPDGGVRGVEVRPITARRRTNRNRVLERAFQVLGRLPRSEQNYFITERWKAENIITTPLFRAERKLLLGLSRYVPHPMSYDRYLDALDVSDSTRIDDVDTVLCFSEIYDDYFLAQLLRARKRVVVYVYSWDHPPKMKRFSQRVSKYLTWNERLRDDLAVLHGIPRDRIVPFGATQFAYIDEYRQLPAERQDSPTADALYIGCAVGIPGVIEQEVAAIGAIADCMRARALSTRVVVRPYPFQRGWDVYAPLRGRPNVSFDDGYRDPGAGLALGRRRIFEKFRAIERARAFMHFGTTMGLEATYFETPSLLGDFTMPRNGALNLGDFVHQYQNDKYLNLPGSPNVVRAPEQVADAVADIERDRDRYLEYNRRVRAATPVKSFERLRDELVELLA